MGTGTCLGDCNGRILLFIVMIGSWLLIDVFDSVQALSCIDLICCWAWIIRQRLKRQHSANAGAGAGRTTETSDSAPVTVPPDKKSKTEVSTEGAAGRKWLFNSFTTVLHKQRNKPQQTLQRPSNSHWTFIGSHQTGTTKTFKIPSWGLDWLGKSTFYSGDWQINLFL